MRGEYEDIADMDLPKVNSSSAVKSSYFSKFKVASCILMLVLLVASLNFFLIDEEHRPLPPRWNNQRLVEVSRSTFGFQNGDDHEVLKACYDPNGTISTPLNPSGVIRGVNNILHHIVNTRSFASDASFVPMTTGISTHTANKDTNAIVAATGKYVHTGLDPLGTKQCEVETPMHIFQEVDDDYKIVNEWQHVNYSHFIHNIRRCNSLNLPLGPKFAQDVITKVFPDVIEYGWNGTELINLANRFWSDLNLNAEMAKESVTVDIQDAVKKLADIMQEAGISTTPVAPNYPSIVVDGHSEEYSTISVLVAQEIVGISVKTGSKCSFRMQWIHAYIIQRHYRIAGFVTAGNSNEFNTSIRDCNKFGSQEYGYSNWHQQQQATKTIMDDLKRNRILEKLLSGRASIAVVNNTVVATGMPMLHSIFYKNFGPRSNVPVATSTSVILVSSSC